MLIGLELDTEPFAASAVYVDSLQFAALDLVQHGLSGDAKCCGGLVEAEPALGYLGSDPIKQGLVDADAPGCTGGDLLGGDESVADPAVQSGPGDAEDLFGGGDGDHDDIVAVGSDIGYRQLVDGDVVAGAQDRHPRSGEGQAGGGAAFCLASIAAMVRSS